MIAYSRFAVSLDCGAPCRFPSRISTLGDRARDKNSSSHGVWTSNLLHSIELHPVLRTRLRSDPIAIHHTHHRADQATHPLVILHPDSRPSPCPISLSATSRPLLRRRSNLLPIFPSSPARDPLRPLFSRGPPSPMLCLNHHGGAS
jgi:hypothetical protein